MRLRWDSFGVVDYQCFLKQAHRKRCERNNANKQLTRKTIMRRKRTHGPVALVRVHRPLEISLIVDWTANVMVFFKWQLETQNEGLIGRERRF